MTKYEYRIVPKVWEYRSKVYQYQSEKTFTSGIPFTEENRERYRYERREVSNWEPVDPVDYAGEPGTYER